MSRPWKWALIGSLLGAVAAGVAYYEITYLPFGGSLMRAVGLPAIVAAGAGGLLGHYWGSKKDEYQRTSRAKRETADQVDHPEDSEAESDA